MSNLKDRVAKIEQAVGDVDLKAMSDDELLCHAGTFPMFSDGMYAAVVTLVLRRPSAFPVVYDDPERTSPGCKG